MGVGTGKLGALRTFVTTSSNVPEPRVGEESHRSDELQPNGALQAALYAALRREIPDLVTRWTTQVQPIFSPDLSSTDAGDRLTPASDLAEDLVRVLVTALAAGDEESEAAVVAGLRFGGDAFARGVSLHHTGKAVDCLVAMAMVA